MSRTVRACRVQAPTNKLSFCTYVPKSMRRPYKVHGSNFRSVPLEQSPRIIIIIIIRIRDPCNHDRAIVHHESEDLIKQTLGEFGHGYAGLRITTTNAPSRDPLEFGHIEPSVSVLELGCLVLQPSSAGAAEEIFVFGIF